MAYLKPQSPLKHKDGDYFYPLTTADQIIMEDGSRLSATLSSAVVAVDINDDGNVELRSYVISSISSAEGVAF